MLVIPNESMPESCWQCPCNDYEYECCRIIARRGGSEEISTANYTYGHGRRRDCPLYEAPEGARWVVKKFKNGLAGDNSGQISMAFDVESQFVGFKGAVRGET